MSRTYTIRWRRVPAPNDHLECHHLTAERLVSRLRNALRQSAVVIDAVEPESAEHEPAITLWCTCSHRIDAHKAGGWCSGRTAEPGSAHLEPCPCKAFIPACVTCWGPAASGKPECDRCAALTEQIGRPGFFYPGDAT